MNNQIYIPTEDCFKDTIHAIWQVDHSTAFRKEFIIPKGEVEVIYNFSIDAVLSSQQGKQQQCLPKCFISGYNTSPIETVLPVRHVFFGVLFQPLAVRKIFGSPAAEFLNRVVDLSLLNPSFHSLWEQLAEQDDFNSRAAIVQRWVEQYYIDWQPHEQLINQQHLSVKELANDLCYSPRHLSRKLLDATGMNTEDFLLYKKYLHACTLYIIPTYRLQQLPTRVTFLTNPILSAPSRHTPT